MVGDVHVGGDAQVSVQSMRRERPTSGCPCGNGKGRIFVRGKAVRTVPESRIVRTLLEEALRRDWSVPAG
jgi:4-hydroxy-3-methylbut-2-en-1-yl diphosphate synthase IspG/GcpE